MNTDKIRAYCLVGLTGAFVLMGVALTVQALKPTPSQTAERMILELSRDGWHRHSVDQRHAAANAAEAARVAEVRYWQTLRLQLHIGVRGHDCYFYSGNDGHWFLLRDHGDNSYVANPPTSYLIAVAPNARLNEVCG